MIYRKFAIAILTLAALAVTPAVASADNYCVGVVAECTASPEPAFTQDAAGIAAAIAAANANPGADNVYLAADTYTLASALAPTFAASQDIHIIGAGVGQSVFTGSVASVAQLTLNFTTATSDAKGFSVNVTGTPSNATGVQVFTGGISDFAVNQPGGLASNFHAVELDSGATARRGSVALTSGNGVGLHFDASSGSDDGEGDASEMTLTGGAQASIGIAVDAVTAASRNFDRMRISNFGRGIEVTDGSFLMNNSVIDMGTINAAQGVDAFNGLSISNIVANMNRVTIVGSGPFQTALNIGATAAPFQSFSGGFSDLVLFASGESSTGLLCTGGGVSVTATFNSFAIRGAELDVSACNPTLNNKVDLASTDPGFRNFSGGDFRLKPTSPLVDAGVVGEVISSSERDLIGGTRVVDGDANGTATVDLGAFEYQRTSPTVVVNSSPSACRATEICGFSATGTDADGETLSFAWSFDDGATATGDSASHAFATAGPHTATVTATDESGLTSSATAVAVVAPLPVAKVTAKPKKAFAQARRGFGAPKAKKPFFRVTFADTAKAKFALQSKRNGKLKSVKGSQTLKVKTGANKFAFGGKFGGKKLKPGKYRATITPIGADGFAGKPVTVDFSLK